MSTLFIALQKLVPQHGLSRLAGRFAQSEVPWIKQLFINQFAKAYGISLAEAEREQLDDYRNFNDFFTRALKPDARPIAQDPFTIVSPADGSVSQAGMIRSGELMQAKGHNYSLNSLAGQLGQDFENGTFCTIYLAPSDYHRVHLPFSGTLTDTLAVPGELFSVNAHTTRSIEGLFARNERIVCRFDTQFGPMLVILVGAMIVASIETDWLGPTSPYTQLEHNTHHLVYERGDEIGRFLLGSTVICCFPRGVMNLTPNMTAEATVRMGAPIGHMHVTDS